MCIYVKLQLSTFSSFSFYNSKVVNFPPYNYVFKTKYIGNIDVYCRTAKTRKEHLFDLYLKMSVISK